ncbi:hypothetical protein TNCT_159761 [Trichonephila clavata]|uniref:Uncharacterized protein n=1 Tax=Trichonephila clavata TaxID=2740835 RepID=A0A8X6FKN1_TRICU|nr:hypothetical protein TNCT_159761 [Trichonephila clavata]
MAQPSIDPDKREGWAQSGTRIDCFSWRKDKKNIVTSRMIQDLQKLVILQTVGNTAQAVYIGMTRVTVVVVANFNSS